MTNTDLNIIDTIKRNSKLTHSDLAISEKEFAKYKNVLELLEKASEVSTDLRAKLEKLDLDTLHYSYKIMCVHSSEEKICHVNKKVAISVCEFANRNLVL